jgi:hypothetical protein
MKRSMTGLLFFALAAAAAAQELEPRAYSPSPIGLNFAVVGFARSTGGVILDPSIPVTDVNARINAFAIGYGRTFGILGRQALVTASLPYAWGDVEGKVQEQAARITRSGLTDLKAKLSVNLYGSPALTPAVFMKQRPNRLLVGVSFTLSAPTGQYFSEKLINLGTSRWAFKPEVGVSFSPWDNLYVDLYGGAWFFTANPDFYPGGNNRTQDPLTSLQFHVSYTILQGLWVAADGTWYSGGAAHVNGGPPTARQSNSRVGVTIAIPVGRAQSVKLNYSAGASVRTGTDFKAIGVAYQLRWF